MEEKLLRDSAEFSPGTVCLHLVEVTTTFPFSGGLCSVSSYCVGKGKLFMHFQTSPAQGKSKRKGEFEPCGKLGDKID